MIKTKKRELALIVLFLVILLALAGISIVAVGGYLPDFLFGSDHPEQKEHAPVPSGGTGEVYNMEPGIAMYCDI